MLPSKRLQLLSALLLSTLLLPGCSTAKSLRRVRALPADVGTRVEIAGSLAELSQQLPMLMRDLGYRDIAIEQSAHGSVVVYGAIGFTAASFGHGIRLTLAPSANTQQVSRIDLALARRVRGNESEDLQAARVRILAALAERFP